MPRTHSRTFHCQECQQPFDTTEYRANRLPKFCSRACRDEARRTGVMLTCRQCGEGFYRKRYQETWSQERGPFCSMPCYGAWQRENALGPENPNWTEQSNARYSGQWERNRRTALERDGHRCVKCGSPDFLHVHHVVPWEAGQDDPHALDNLVTLCARHHREAHRELGGW